MSKQLRKCLAGAMTALVISLAMVPAGHMVQAQDATPALRDGGPRAAPEPPGVSPPAFGVFIVVLLLGIGIGLITVVAVRRLDRNRQSEREALKEEPTGNLRRREHPRGPELPRSP